MKAMAKNPAERFATANDMRLVLNDYLAGRPVALGNGFTARKPWSWAASPAPAWARPWPTARRSCRAVP